MEKTNLENSSEYNNLETLQDEIDLKDLWNGILRKKKWLFLTAGIFFTGSVIFTVHARIFRPVFRGSFTLLIKDPMVSNNIEKSLDAYGSNLFSEIGRNDSNYEINTLITFLKSPIYLNPIAKEFNISTTYLRKNLSLNQSSDQSGGKSPGILNVNLNYKNQKIGRKILQKLSESYLQSSLEQRQKKLKDGLNFLNQQRPEIQKKKDTLQSELVSFREKYKLIQPEAESSVIKERQKDIENNIIKLTKERDRLKDVRNEIKNGTLTARGLEQELGNGLAISDFDQGLLQELRKVEDELAKAKSKFTNKSVVVQGLQKRLEIIQPSLLMNQLEAVDTALKLNEGSLNSYKELKNDIEKKFLEQPILIKQYQNISQELEIANENLLSLVAARESFQLEMAQNTIPWRIISEPQMGINPIKPDFKFNLLLGLMGGLLFGAIIAALKDRQNHVFNSPSDVKKDLKYTMLGNLPFVEVFKELRTDKESILDLLNKDSNTTKKIDSYQKFFFQEAFRNLYTSIRFLDTAKDNDVKTLVLTSSLPKEGKTLTNILLAKTLADLGVKVLLIDSDLRKPQVHYRLGLNNLKGFSNLLIDPEMRIEDVKNNIKNYDNWSVITGGTLPPDPTRLLGSQRFKNVIEEIKNTGDYEIILFDSPPILGLADSLLISEVADGVIILIGLEAVDRSLPKESINKIKSIGLNFYGIVTNQTKEQRRLINQDYGYGQYKGYGGYKYYDYADTYYPISTYQNYNQFEQNEISSQNSKESNLDRSTKNIKQDATKFQRAFQVIKQSLYSLRNWLES